MDCMCLKAGDSGQASPVDLVLHAPSCTDKNTSMKIEAKHSIQPRMLRAEYSEAHVLQPSPARRAAGEGDPGQ